MLLAGCRAGLVGSVLNARDDAIFESWLREITLELEKHRKNGENPATYAVNLVLLNNPRLGAQIDIVKKYKVGSFPSSFEAGNELIDAIDRFRLSLVSWDVPRNSATRSTPSDLPVLCLWGR